MDWVKKPVNDSTYDDETHTTASTNPHHQQCVHAMRTDDVIRNAYDAVLWTLTLSPHHNNFLLTQADSPSYNVHKQ
ncbi:hypothetical protein SFRURICE_001994 [Spodoptera frugiperda]|uniref:SFRICE_005864 n=1 Tax=Spodoptera frugiperda TaxID=7108 RepID=A0A2H1UZV3_SPOFR|nr:hypothetical protein SFRURICE_001994 [Spodoptera frugiperda]